MPKIALLAVTLAALLAIAAAGTVSCTCTGCSPQACEAFASECRSEGANGVCAGTTAICSGEGSCVDDALCVALCEGVCSAGSYSCGKAKCFPASATVEVEGGATKTMAELTVGDRVLATTGVYSPVYMFSHRLEAVKTGFVTVEAAGSVSLQLTPDHYLYVNGVLATAATVTVGDELTLRDGRKAAVTKVHTTWAQGLYNPHTMHGDIVVNGVQTSTYTQGIAPALAHAALWPVRMMYSAGIAIADETTFSEGSDLLAAVLPNGKAQY